MELLLLGGDRRAADALAYVTEGVHGPLSRCLNEPVKSSVRDSGTTGLVIGAGVGALAGHELAGRGDKALGAILGGAVGAVIGREIDRGSLRCR